MNLTPKTTPGPKEVARLLLTHAPRWAVPALLVAVVAIVYAAVRRPTWEASQAMILRNEATGNDDAPGKFHAVEEMKTFQETILELIKSRGVLGAALGEVGPPTNYTKDKSSWPTPRDVAGLRRHVTITPPKGAEFGKTEVFYLKVKDHDRRRAIALNVVICDVLQTRLQELRDIKAKSMIDELTKTVDLAKADLDDATTRLTATEKHLGSDLAELRALDDYSSGDTALQRTMSEIRGELRQIRAARQTDAELLVLLADAGDDPGRLLATPTRLLESQPALRRLKDGLLDAQLHTATLQGRMLSDHPLVCAAKEAEKEIGRHLHNELPIAVRGVEAELRMNRDREALLKAQLAKADERLGRLAALRADYSNDVAETANRTDLVKQAEQNLAEARAEHASAKAASLISRIDTPDAGADPIGPSRATIALVGIVGGLLAGFGVLLLSVPPGVPAAAPRANAAATGDADVTAASPARPNRRLTLKEALQKITCDSAA